MLSHPDTWSVSTKIQVIVMCFSLVIGAFMGSAIKPKYDNLPEYHRKNPTLLGQRGPRGMTSDEQKVYAAFYDILETLTKITDEQADCFGSRRKCRLISNHVGTVSALNQAQYSYSEYIDDNDDIEQISNEASYVAFDVQRSRARLIELNAPLRNVY